MFRAAGISRLNSPARCLLLQIKAARCKILSSGKAIIRNHPMRFALPFLAIAILSVPSAAQAADVAAGKTIFDNTCHNCHSLAVGVNKVGPSLWHIVGRPSAAVQGYAYSDALKALHTEWSADALDHYLANPRADVHGAQMYFKGLSEPRDRANVIAYVQSQQ
jgi:cytochrome c